MKKKYSPLLILISLLVSFIVIIINPSNIIINKFDTETVGAYQFYEKQPESNYYESFYNINENSLEEEFDENFNAQKWTFSQSNDGIQEVRANQGILYMQGWDPYSLDPNWNFPPTQNNIIATTVNLLPQDGTLGDAFLSIRFTAKNINTRMWVCPPIPTFLIYSAKFSVQIRTTQSGSFNTIYSYDTGLLSKTDTIQLNFQLGQLENFPNIFSSGFFQVRLLGELWDVDQFVAIDYVRFQSYSLNLTESKAIVGTSEQQNIDLKFISTNFALDTNPSNVKLYYNLYGGSVTVSSPSINAVYNSGNYTFVFPPGFLSQKTENGIISYRIRFANVNGSNFFTRTLYFLVYDSQAPLLGVPTFNSSINYKSNQLISINVSDPGGTGLKSAKLVWTYGANSEPDENSIQYSFIEIPSGTHQAILNFTIPYNLNKAGVPIRFKIFCYDRRTYGGISNYANTSTYEYNSIDTDAPTIMIFGKSDSVWSNPLNSSQNFIDFGYAGFIEYLVYDLAMGCGFSDKIGPYILAYGYQINGNAPNKSNFRASTNVSDYYLYDPDGFNSQISAQFKIEWDELTFDLDSSIYLFVYAKDSMGNEIFLMWEYTVVDLRPPDILILSDTLENVNFNQTKNFSFLASKNNRAAQVNTSTALFEYGYNNTGLIHQISLEVSASGSNTTLNWYIFNYSIHHSNFTWNTTIQFRFQIKDIKENGFISPIYSIRIKDSFKPTLTFTPSLSNISVIRSYWNYIFCFKAFDEEGGSGLSHLDFFFKNGDEIEFPDSLAYKIPLLNITNGSYYYFFLNCSLIEPGPLSFFVRSYDLDENYQDWVYSTYSYNILRPTIISYSMDESRFYEGTLYTNKRSMNFKIDFNIQCYVYYQFNDLCNNEIIDGTSSLNLRFNLTTSGLHVVKVFYDDYVWTKSIIADFTPPNRIMNLITEKNKNSIKLMWTLNDSAIEKQYYHIYRSNTPNFIPNASNFLVTVEENYYVDNLTDFGKYYYKVVVEDLATNLSDPSEEVIVNYSNIPLIILGVSIGVVALVGLGFSFKYIKERKIRFYSTESNVFNNMKRKQLSDKSKIGSETIHKDLEIKGFNDKESIAKAFIFNEILKEESEIEEKEKVENKNDTPIEEENDGWKD